MAPTNHSATELYKNLPLVLSYLASEKALCQREFSNSRYNKIRLLAVGHGRLTWVLLSKALLTCCWDIPWSLRLEWAFRNHHVFSHLCFLASLLSDDFPQRSLPDLNVSTGSYKV